MSHKEEQEQEVEALESIFPEIESNISRFLSILFFMKQQKDN